MKDAFGGIFNLAIISVFLVVVMGILGLTVNYTKAFRAKNIIISSIEQYGPGATCFNKGEPCFEKIKSELESIAYRPHSISCPSSGTDGINKWFRAPLNATGQNEILYCYAVKDSYTDKRKVVHFSFRVVTQVDIDIPIINKIMGMYFFQVKGDTRKVTEKYVETGINE